MTAPDWYAVVDGTWPAARYERLGPWMLRHGEGGGSRVSSTTQEGPFEASDIDAAEAAMGAMDQRLIFQIRDGQDDLDAALAARGYDIMDPVNIYACPIDQLCDQAIPPVTVLRVWEPLAIMREIWAAGGIGPARLAVMERAKGPKTGLLGRHKDKPAGVAFVAIHDGVAMVHAVEVVPFQRRAGMGRWFMRAAALWARDQGAYTLTVICTRANTAANGLYTSLGMQVVGQYHYRHLPTEHPQT
ncbi:GNAT family N-acetyltransferase [Arenibacterium sp. CAU 1754]